jgi:hypothetical protein
MKMLRIVTAVLMLPALGGCAMSSTNASQRFDYGAYLAEPNVTVEILNNSSSDVEVFALGPAIRYRLGMVATVGPHAFKIPYQLIRDGLTISFMAVPIGGGMRYPIGTARVEPGDHIELTVRGHSGRMRGQDLDR